MFKFIVFISLFCGFQAHADSVHWRVGAIEGFLQALGNLVLEDAKAVMICQYCHVSTCAGGPVDKTVLQTKLTAQNSTNYHLSIHGGVHSSGYLFKNLSGCSYLLAFKGHDAQTGAQVIGQFALAHSGKNDSQPIWENKTLAQDLTEVLTSRPLQLEIKKQGFNDPEIHPVENN